MTVLSIDEIVDYSVCPMLHYFKHVDKKSDCKIDMLDKYKQDLLKVVRYSFYMIQQGETLQTHSLSNMWGKLWIKDKRRSSIVFSESTASRDLYNDKRVKGIEGLLKFRDFLLKSPGYPIVVDKEYKVKIDDDLYITGRFQAIREIENKDGEKEIQVCMFSPMGTNSRINNTYNLRFHCDALALEQYVQEDLKLSYLMFYIEKGKHSTKKYMDNKSMFLHNVKTISKLIKDGVYYMTSSESCDKCLYKGICLSKSNSIGLLDMEVKR